MDSTSVITLSSGSSSSWTSHKHNESIISIVSDQAKVPTFQENGKREIVDVEQTPNNTEKVKSWIRNCDLNKPAPAKYDKQPSICIRYDFEKPQEAKPSSPKSSYVRSTPLSTYMEEVKTLASKKSPNGAKVNGNHMKKSDLDSPLSPESQKKELCNYLQLMKPEDKQNDALIEFRRSGRLKTQNVEVDEQFDKEKYSTLKSLKDLNMNISKLKKILSFKLNNEVEENKLLPLPPKEIYEEIVNFEESIRPFLADIQKKVPAKKSTIRRKFRFAGKYNVKLRTTNQSSKRMQSLRSRGFLKNISIDKLIARKNLLRRKARKKEYKAKHLKSEEAKTCRVEIVSFQPTSSDEEYIDLKNFVDDMLELDKMSAEHRKSVIENRILASESITNLANKKGVEESDVQKAFKIFSELSGEQKSSEEDEVREEEKVAMETDEDNLEQVEPEKSLEQVQPVPVWLDHDYVKTKCSDETDEQDEENESDDEDDESMESDFDPVPIKNTPVLPVSKVIERKSLHQSLTQTNKRRLSLNNYGLNNWSSNSNSNRKINHSIEISQKDGKILRLFYQDYNLIIAQQNLISFWTQSALGNVLGAQNMWVPKGQVKRIPLNSTYMQKKTMDMVIATEPSVAYVELWTKEHKSDLRELPIADVFAIVYFMRVRQNALEKKALQLENIKGFVDDVQYCVLKTYPRIIVSWHSVQGNEKKTKIHLYHLAADFQTVASINEIQPVEHYVSSLHNIEDCESLIMGCGENKVTIWNVEYRCVVATIEMLDIKSPLSTQWIKCDRGFLFTVQECDDHQLRLIAINGMNHSWKRLQNYVPSPEFKNLKGACIDNGLLIAYYAEGILCWNAQTGELIVEEVPNECEYIPSGKFVIILENENIIVRHSLSYLVSN